MVPGVSFVFNNSPELAADVASFLADGVIPARHFSFELLKLKRMICGGEYMSRAEKNEDQKAEELTAVLDAANAYIDEKVIL